MTNNNDIRMVAEFMGWESNKYRNLPTKLHKGDHGRAVEDFDYHTSWNSQIEVWSKLQNQSEYKVLMGDHVDYMQAVDTDNPAAAFQIIVNILKRMK